MEQRINEDVKAILLDCGAVAEANPTISKAEAYNNGIRASFMKLDNMNKIPFSDKEPLYQYTDYIRQLCRALIEELKNDSFDGVDMIIRGLNARMDFLIDTPKYIAEQITSTRDIRAEYEQFRKWTNRYDVDFTKSVFEQIKDNTALCRTLANELLSAADEDIDDTGKRESFSRKLTAYLKRNGIVITESKEQERGKAGRPKGKMTKPFKEWLLPEYRKRDIAITRLTKEFVSDKAETAALFIKALCNLSIIGLLNNEKSSLYRTLKSEFMVQYAYNTFSEQYKPEQFEGKSKDIKEYERQIKARLSL